MLLKHCSYADLARMSLDDVETENRFLDAFLEAKVKASKTKTPPGKT